MKLKVILVDDEQLARERLRRLLGADGAVEIAAECADGPSAVEAVRRLRPDLLFLDVRMPGMDGFDVLRSLDAGEMPPAVIFVTGFDQHAVRAFEARAIDYLLKPTTGPRLAEALVRVRERRGEGSAVSRRLLDFVAGQEAADSRLRRIPVRDGERIIFVPVEDVRWIEAAGNYIVLHTPGGNHICRETLGGLEAQLPESFLRSSRSAILNLRHVREIHSLPGGDHAAILSDGSRIPITRSLREIEARIRLA